MSKHCCRVRFLLADPRLPVRRAWLDRWRKQDGDRIVDLIEEEVKAKWSKR